MFKLMCHINHIHFYINLYIMLLMCHQLYLLIITFTLVYMIFVAIFLKENFCNNQDLYFQNLYIPWKSMKSATFTVLE